ncbi:uncharacterized protein BO97DRAFT_62679 [Aspergillus homomorphus CBS 101889]|uniref:Uncharacterized protein n=1 Tax=Aspergillus homomorphus (strain CBS 101889) TaxID=1450537 RepID=A0A395HWD5_ASPHC|nr:hypothetical protein BO97DRAFT_62679 [Aspergillus homomorphus CBS 101889]RAL12222.1 hypothetical protein BO97DRAFT_62679 [Aspergillus homomorphus CBS 101889]
MLENVTQGFQAFRGYRKPLPLTELQNASAIDLTDNGSTNYKRHTVHFGSLPLPRTHSGFIQRKWQVKRKATPTEAASRAHLAELGDTTLDVRINGDGLGPKQQEPFVQSSGAITVVGEMGTFEADDKVHPSNRSAQLTNTHLLPDSTGASRIQFTINGTPMTTPADGPDHGCTASGEQREAGISIEGRPANQSSDSIKATRDEALLSWTVGNPPARFVEHRREASQLSVSSLGTADDGGPNLALNTHAASSSLSLPSSLGGGMDTAATGDARSMTPSRLPHGRHLPHQHTQVSSISSCPPSRTATPVPAAPPSAERNDRASASHPTPQARLAAMKMKYGEKIRDIRRISISAKEPEQKPTPPYKNAFGRLTGLLRPRRGNKPKISSVADTDCRPATSASIRSPKVVVPINHIDPALSKPGHARFYSVDNNSSLSDRHHLENVAPDQLRSTSLTPDPFHRAHIIPPNASDPVMPTRTASQTSSRSPSRGRDPERGYTRNLHMRSRSPKPYAPGPEGETASITDITDPAHNLGIFRTRPRTSRSGDQELPWKLSIPGGDDEPEEIHKNDRKAHHRESSELWSARITGEVLSCIGNSSILQPPPPPQPSEPEPPKNNTQKQPPARVGNAPLLNPHPSPGRTLHRRAGSNVVASDAMIPPPPPPPPQFKLPAQPLTLLAGNPDESKNKAAEQQRPSTSQAPAQDTKRNNDEPDNPPPPQTAHPHRPEPPRAIVNTPIELPVPARDGADDSTGDSHEDDESEIVMSSTAYPGQEWKPVGFMGVGMGYD